MKKKRKGNEKKKWKTWKISKKEGNFKKIWINFIKKWHGNMHLIINYNKIILLKKINEIKMK